MRGPVDYRAERPGHWAVFMPAGKGSPMSESRPYEVTVLRQATCDPCPDDETCFIAGTVPARPGKVQAVAQTVADPALIAAYAHKIGPGEVLVEFDEEDWR